MKKPLLSLLLIVFSVIVYAAPGNDDCSSATTIAASPDYNPTAGNLYNCTKSTSPGTGSAGSRYDVWYKITIPTGENQLRILVNLDDNSSTNTNNVYVELFNSTGCSLANKSLGSFNITSLRQYDIGGTAGSYTLRVYTTSTPTSGSSANWGFTIAAMYNNNCSTAATITPGTVYEYGGLYAATASTAPAGCGSSSGKDVWYKFTATNTDAAITLYNLSSAVSTDGIYLQLYDGNAGCGSLTSVACSAKNILYATGLVVGRIYYLRLYANGTPSYSNGQGQDYSMMITPPFPTQQVGSGRMNEVFQQEIISPAGVLLDPWEVTYGPDGKLWVTESKGSRVYRYDPLTGSRDTVLDISQGSTFLPSPYNAFNLEFDIQTISDAPQGGLAGLALHPKFMASSGAKNYVYISYVKKFINKLSSNKGVFYQNMIARFVYNTTTGKLETPVFICDTLPGSSDHNSQRMIVAPVNGVDYLFYGQGDMGAGQFGNQNRANHAQDTTIYEGKILRFNLEPDGDADNYQKWIPNDNPYPNSAVWDIGMRNNQGFAYDTARGILYGSTHGPYSDDEINIIQRKKNYGHPLVIGYAADGNYNTSTAGSPNTTSACPMITDENAMALSLPNYKDPLFSAYARPQSEIHNIWVTNPNNGGWPSEGWSGLDFYSNTVIPGWKNSLIACSLKWGRLLKLKTDAAGDSIIKTGTADTVSYFGSQNRFRDVAFSPSGKDMYVVIDRSSTTSGPTASNPIVSNCGGCIQRYTFLGYADASGKSSIPKIIPVSTGTPNTCVSGTTITIDDTNNMLWVPITGPDGDIVAEIKANGNNLGVVTSSFYTRNGNPRISGGVRYANRNVRITPTNQPSSNVGIRLYISKAEFDSLRNTSGGAITKITDLNILKNSDACGSAIASSTTLISTTVKEFQGVTGDTLGYVLQGNISGFSSFYFGPSLITLPVSLVSFSGNLNGNNADLHWKTASEVSTSAFVVERSVNGTNFTAIGTVNAAGNATTATNYDYTDYGITTLGVNVVYYRLKMVDANGEFKYSNVVPINLSLVTGTLRVTPNPVITDANVLLAASENGKVTWVLSDNAGHVLNTSVIEVRKGMNSFPVQMQGFAAGTYYLNVSGGGVNQHVKIQKF